METLKIRVPSIAFNRRTVRKDGKVETNFRYPLNSGDYDFSAIDDELTAIRFRTTSGSGAVLVNYGCHPVTGGEDQESDHYRISSDYIYHLRRTIEDAWGIPAFFTLGAAGDVVPRDRFGASRRRIGAILGNAVVVADRMFQPAGDDVGLISKRGSIPVETIISVDAEKAEAEYRKYSSELRGRSGSLAPEESARFARALMEHYRGRQYPENRFDVPIHFFGIGPLSFVALPFEVLSEFAIRMKREHPESVLVSCAGGYQGYLPFEYEYARGGYEASERSTHFKPGTADMLYERVLMELAGL